MSVGDVVEQLRQARAQIPSSRLAEAADAIDQIRHTLAELGSEQDDAVEAYACAERIAELVEQARQVDATVRDKIETYLAQIGGSSGTSEPAAPAASSPGSGSPGSDASGSAHSIEARDGSRYPVAAQWAIDEGLPARVERYSQRPTSGYIQYNGMPMAVRSGDDPFSDMVDERLRAVGVRRLGNLRRHVEMKVAAMQVRQGIREQEIVINHAPCGSEQGGRGGCHAMLEPFLPSGYSLTVHGTTADGKPFSRTYHGKG